MDVNIFINKESLHPETQASKVFHMNTKIS